MTLVYVAATSPVLLAGLERAQRAVVARAESPLELEAKKRYLRAQQAQFGGGVFGAQCSQREETFQRAAIVVREIDAELMEHLRGHAVRPILCAHETRRPSGS